MHELAVTQNILVISLCHAKEACVCQDVNYEWQAVIEFEEAA